MRNTSRPSITFRQAVALDPTLINARLYLATAFAQQYIPGADTPDNNKFADQAIEQYKIVLETDPKNINSVKGIAYLYLQGKKFDLAKTVLQEGLRRLIRTIQNRITPSLSSIGRRPIFHARKSALNSA